MRKVLLITLSVFALTTQADYLPASHNWNDGSVDPFVVAISAAQNDYSKALAAAMAWRDTGSMIDKAKDLHKAGKVDEATELAKKAHNQAVSSLAQIELAKSAGPRF